MTQTARSVEHSLEPVIADAAPRRRLLGRLSLGHLVMILAGLMAFLLVLVVLRENTETTAVAKTVVEVPAGARITASDVELVQVVGDSLAGAVLNADEVNAIITGGQVSTRLLAPGTLLQPSDFSVAEFQTEIRSMSIPVGPANAVAGSLKVGDLVDVVATSDDFAWYVVTSAEVLAVADPSTGGFASNDYTVTVVVTPSSALRVACAIDGYSLNVVRATGAVPIEPSVPPGECGG